MSTPSRVLLALAAFFVAVPLALLKPGWPGGMKSDEPAYYLMARSLAEDGDLVCDLGDLRRLFDDFPFHSTNNLILMSDDGWHTVFFGKPYVYSLFAAPWAWLFGANGLVACNVALVFAMVALGARYLRRWNDAGSSLLFSAGFVLLSATYPYVFWMHPEVFNMTAVMASLYLGLTEPGGPPGTRRWLADPRLRAAASAAALALAVYNKPMLAALALPTLVVLARRRSVAVAGAWVGGGLAAAAAILGLSVALTGHASPYLGVSRGGFEVCSPHEMPVQPAVEATPPANAEPAGEPGEPVDDAEIVAPRPPRPGAASWWWIFRVPELEWREIAERLEYFFFGRHTGLFLYFPFTAIVLALFLVYGRRSLRRWAVLAATAAVALSFLLWIPFNWHGGGGFVGNRYFVNAYPALLFLVTRLGSGWVTLAGYALGGLFLGPTLLTPYGRAVPWPTLQAHVRNFPFSAFPLELSLKGIPGYDDFRAAGVRFRGRADVFLPRNDHAWLHGATAVEVWAESAEPLADLVFDLTSRAAPNEVVVRLDGIEERLLWADGEAGARKRVVLRPDRPSRVRYNDGRAIFVYHLRFRPKTGEVAGWTQVQPPATCAYFPWNPSSEESFYVGAELAFMGGTERLGRAVFALEWGDVRAPAAATPGEVLAVEVTVRNASAASWPGDPPAAVAVGYHWLDAGGRTVDYEGRRTFLGRDVAPGEIWTGSATVVAPAEAGSYLLELDLVFEGVSWFSGQGATTLRRPVEVRGDGRGPRPSAVD